MKTLELRLSIKSMSSSVSEIHEYQKSNSSAFCTIYNAMAFKKIFATHYHFLLDDKKNNKTSKKKINKTSQTLNGNICPPLGHHTTFLKDTNETFLPSPCTLAINNIDKSKSA